MSRRRGPVETAEYAAMIRRMVAAHGRRVADGDVDDLDGLVALRHDLDAACAEAVAGLRHGGVSWTDIGRALGTTRQAAQMRWSVKAPTARMPAGQDVLPGT